MKLRVGEVLVKKRGGGGKKVRVTSAWHPSQGSTPGVWLASDAKHNNRSTNARQWWVPIGEDGLPEGYKRATT